MRREEMRFQNLLLSAATAFCLVGASGAAMAVENCANGFLSGVIEEDVIIDGTNCTIQDASVSGDIIATGVGDMTVFSTKASGKIQIQDGGVATVGISSARNIRVRRNQVAIVFGNLANRNLVVNRNAIASVKQNGATLSIICRGNLELDETRNNTEGEEECREEQEQL